MIAKFCIATPSCKVAGGRARYYQGELGALMSVLGHCEPCDKKVKYTGFRTFNSLYPCHGPGDLVVHMPRGVGPVLPGVLN